MIQYHRSPFGLNLISRAYGSAVYRGVLPGLLSVACLVMIRLLWVNDEGASAQADVKIQGTVVVYHTYALGALVSGISLLLVFRLRHAYGRYWEAAGAIYHMQSKWMDAIVHSAVYHMQCRHYEHITPPSFFDYEDLNFVGTVGMTRDREESDEVITFESIRNTVTATLDEDTPSGGSAHLMAHPECRRRMRANNKSIESVRMPRGSTSFEREPSMSFVRQGMTPHGASVRSVLSTAGQEGSGRGGGSARRTSRNDGEQSGSSTLQPGNNNAPLDPSDGQSSSLHTRSGHDRRSGATSGGGESDALAPPPAVEDNFPGRSLEGVPRLDGNWGEYYTYPILPGMDKSKPPAAPTESTASVGSNSSAPEELNTFWDPSETDSKSDIFDAPMPRGGFSSFQGGRTPALFLQELAHMGSLMNAVALGTLRLHCHADDFDAPMANEMPLCKYEPGSPWPAVDPAMHPDATDQMPDEAEENEPAAKKLAEYPASFVEYMQTIFGYGRSIQYQAEYNHVRAMPVIGGISDAERRFLEMARGPYAKFHLAWYWLSELVMREYEYGALGKVAAPMPSRIIQFLSDGNIFYNHARKIMFIPFPFCHAQMCSMYVIFLIPVVALLMHHYAEDMWVGGVLTFLAVTCLAGVNEVACELEHPYTNVPNELPLVTIQAQFNEALLIMYAGYHPDHYWKKDAEDLIETHKDQIRKNKGGEDDIHEHHDDKPEPLASVPTGDEPPSAALAKRKHGDPDPLESAPPGDEPPTAALKRKSGGGAAVAAGSDSRGLTTSTSVSTGLTADTRLSTTREESSCTSLSTSSTVEASPGARNHLKPAATAAPLAPPDVAAATVASEGAGRGEDQAANAAREEVLKLLMDQLQQQEEEMKALRQLIDPVPADKLDSA